MNVQPTLTTALKYVRIQMVHMCALATQDTYLIQMEVHAMVKLNYMYIQYIVVL